MKSYSIIKPRSLVRWYDLDMKISINQEYRKWRKICVLKMFICSGKYMTLPGYEVRFFEVDRVSLLQMYIYLELSLLLKFHWKHM